MNDAPATPAAAGRADGDIRPGYSVFVLAFLIVVYTFNFIDRQIIAILAEPMKQDLGLTDTQLGWLGGPAFAIFYTFFGIPVAWLADRVSRTWVITISLSLWSLMTAVCGVAQNFGQLFLARLGVGVGEAGGAAPSYSLITDYFQPDQRARALGVFSMGIPIGSALGAFFGGWIATAFDWRVAFITAGVAGLLIAPFFRASVREPARGRLDPPATRHLKAASIGETFSVLARKPSFWLLSFAASMTSLVGYGTLGWLGPFFIRYFKISPGEAGTAIGALLLVGGISGLLLGGWIADTFGKVKRGAYAVAPAVALLLALPLNVLAFLSTDQLIGTLLLVAPVAVAHFWLGPVISAIQHLARTNMRATASAIFLFINNLIGLSGPLLIGWLSDGFQPSFGADSLRYAILATLTAHGIAAILYLLAARRLTRDWET